MHAERGYSPSSNPFRPVPRLAMQMGNGNHQNIVVFNGVNNAIRKTLQSTAPGIGAQGMPGQRKLPNLTNRVNHLNQESLTQSGALRLVPLHRLVQFKLGVG
jgi:hypothetical protein